MKFWQVSAAILSLKMLELLVAYVFMRLDDLEAGPLIFIVMVWLALSGAIWTGFRFVDSVIRDSRNGA